MIFSRTRGWIGVDIGTHAVKVAQVERRGSRVELVEALSIPRQEPWQSASEETTDIASSFEIQSALSLGTRFRGREAAVTLPMAICDIRTCNVAGESDSEQRAAVLDELCSGDPEIAENRQFDFWSIELPSDHAPAADNAIALSIASSWASRVAEDMRDSGLVGQVLDGLPLATARAVALSMPNVASPIAAVDWGHHRATLCCVKHGRPLFVRCLRDGGFHAVTNAICKALAVTADEAQKLLRDHGLPSRTGGSVTELQGVIEEVVREPLDRVIEELRRTTAYLAHQRRSIAPTKLVLLGGGAAVKNMASYLDERLDISVENWSFDVAATADTHSLRTPIELFGPAIALSTLAWAK